MDGETARKDKTHGANYAISDAVMQSLVDAFLPDIIEFYSTKAGRRKFEEWIKQRDLEIDIGREQ